MLDASTDDLIEVSLTPGRHDFDLVFGGGLPERLGSIVTLMSVLLVLGSFALTALLANRQKSIVEGQCVTSWISAGKTET
jgi:hypothetical protein